MITSAPHYLLSVEASRTERLGRWRFTLASTDGAKSIEASDVEPNLWGERLCLLTIVRALEALDQPSRVTLVGCSRYIEQGIRFGVHEWRETDWRWEYFGQMVPVRDADLWQRMNQAMEFHQIDCSQHRFDKPHAQVSGSHWNGTRGGTDWTTRNSKAKWLKYTVPMLAVLSLTWFELTTRLWQLGVRQAAGCFSSFLLHRS